EGKIVVSEPDRFDASMTTLKAMVDEDSEIVTLIVGEEGQLEEAQRIEEALLELDDELEIEIHEGNQPVYPYIFSVE
ncbi:hypothetical protein C7P63_07590, partial [Vagococcus humatus]